MPMYFRIQSTVLSGKVNSVQRYCGFRCDAGEIYDLISALEPFKLVEVVVPLKVLLSGATGENEVYYANLGDWSDGLLEYGIDRLRAELVAAGLVDQTAGDD